MNPPLQRSHLTAAFPAAYPSGLRLTDSYGDAVDETEEFRDVAWTEVGDELLNRRFEAPCFLSPEAMRYFLPAYINCSLANPQGVALPTDYLLGCLGETDNSAWMGWRSDRWSPLTEPQWMIVTQWIEWLRETPGAADFTNLESAWSAVNSGVWRGMNV